MQSNRTFHPGFISRASGYEAVVLSAARNGQGGWKPILCALVAVLIAVAGSISAQAQTIRQNGTFAVLPPSTIASTGTGYAQPGLDTPQQVKVGADGSIYVADTSNSRILKYVPTSLPGYGTSCPGGTLSVNTGAAYLTSQTYCEYLVASGFTVPPRSVAVNSAGDVYVMLYFGSANSTYTYYYYLQYRGLPSASGTTCTAGATNCSGGYNGYNCASQTACTNYTKMNTTNDLGGKSEGIFVDTYGTVFIAVYGSKLFPTGMVAVERPNTAVVPSTVVAGNVTVLGTPPPSTAASYSEMNISGQGYSLDMTEDQWANILIAGYNGGIYVLQCGNGSSCTQSTSSFTGAQTSSGNGYGAVAGSATYAANTPYPSVITTATTAYPAASGIGKISGVASVEQCNGVTLDGVGNMYISCFTKTGPSSRIYKYPLTSAGVYSTTGNDIAAQLAAPGGVLGATLTASTTDNLQGISFDPTHPNVLYGAVGNSATNSYIIQLTLGAKGINGPVNLGSSPIGTPVTTYVNMVATSSTAATNIYAVTLDGTSSDFAVSSSTAAGSPFCNVAAAMGGSSTDNNAGGGCVVGVTFTPTRAGTEYGAVIFASSTAILGWGYVQGTGTGAVANFLNPTEKVVASGLTNAPTGLVVDNSGNLYYTATGLANAVQLASSSSYPWTATSLNDTTALTAPKSIAMDGVGILYVADSSNTRLQKFLPNLAHSLTGFTQSSYNVGTALTSTNGVFVDAYGSVYIANTGANMVQIEPWNGVNNGTGWQTEIVLPAPSSLTPSTLSSPKAVTVDSSGNVYVADSGNSRVLKYTLTTAIGTPAYVGSTAYATAGFVNTYTPSVVTSTPTNPTALSLDPNGNLYIADAGGNNIYKETYSGGSYTESIVTTSALSGPLGLAVAPNGNIFIADSGNNRILLEDVADTPTLTFNAVSGTTSPVQTVTLANDGNAPLVFPIPGSGTNPSVSAGYTLATGSGSDCPQLTTSSSSSASLASGGTCVMPISFSPTAVGAANGSLVVTDNSLTATSTTQSITLNGTGTGTIASINFALASGTVGVTQNITVTIKDASGNTVGAFTGTVSFTSSDTAATLPASYTFTTADAGVHVFPITLGTAGSDSVTITDSVDSVSATQSAAIAAGTQTITFAQPTTPVQFGNVAPYVLGATASSGLSVGYTVTGPGVLTGNNLTFTGAGTVVVTASQPGNGSYAAATSVARTIVATPGTFVAGAVSTQAQGSPSTMNVTLTFNSTFTLGSLVAVAHGSTGTPFVITSGGSCVVGNSYTSGSSCTVAVQFTPKGPGLVTGVIEAFDNAGTPLLQAANTVVEVRYH